MSLTLLLDLDDTLLANPMDSFLGAYLKALGRHVSGRTRPDVFVQRLMAATDVMVRNDRIGRTLEETFDDAFYASIGSTKAEYRDTLEHFYREVFPSVRSVTRAVAEARQVVEQALQRGWRVAVATNPLFPASAIFQRLDWAGLEGLVDQLDVVSTYETFHFAKPNPAYYAEVLAQMGWPEQPVIMAGNSLEEDIQPAQQIGIAGFWVLNGTSPATSDAPCPSGTLAEFGRYLAELDVAGLPVPQQTPASLIAALRGIPAALDTRVRQMAAEDWRRRPAPDEWSTVEMACHLRDVDREINQARIERILTEDNPFIAGIDSDSWAVERGYAQQSGALAFADFLAARQSLVDRLAGLASADWQRPARHAIFGPTTLLDLVNIIVTHDRVHLRQWFAVHPIRHARVP